MELGPLQTRMSKEGPYLPGLSQRALGGCVEGLRPTGVKGPQGAQVCSLPPQGGTPVLCQPEAAPLCLWAPIEKDHTLQLAHRAPREPRVLWLWADLGPGPWTLRVAPGSALL